MANRALTLVTRLKLVVLITVICFFIIVLRLFYLQIHLFRNFFLRGQRNFLRIEKVLSPRGSIVDCNGELLATNRPVATLYWCGSGKNPFMKSQEELLMYLESAIPWDCTKEELVVAETQRKKIIVCKDMPFELLMQLLELFPQSPYIEITTCFKRLYPYKSVACHIIGYLGALTADPLGQGQMGLEKIFEDQLRGRPGEILTTVNSVGNLIMQEEIKQAQKGGDLQLTLDITLQRIAEEIFPQSYAGVLLLIEPRTGALKVILSAPGFDPNLFVDGISQETWDQLNLHKKPFINRIFNATYPPASLFKLITMCAALETHITTTDSSWNCRGSTFFCGRHYYCSNRRGHGVLSALEGVAKSCNIPFYEIGKKIKIDTLARYAFRFGLGEKTQSMFPEKAGLIPTSQWKRETRNEPWWPGETLSVAIGQSFLLATPIQLACMVSAICEGYLVKPRLLEAEALERKKLDINDETLEFLKSSMRGVIKSGTGQRLRRLANIEIFAKTGTAQTSSFSNRSLSEETKEHAWFVSYLKYKDEEPLTLLVFLEHAGSSNVALSVAQKFFVRLIRLMEKRRK